MLSTPLADLKIVAFDLETSGKYPIGSEICEMAAVQWASGQELNEFQTLIRPSRPMSDEVVAIHGISNEMVQNQPEIQDQIHNFYQFVKDSVMVAHHAPFDMGFLAWDFERVGLEPLQTPVLCSSLLSRALIKESPNHRLITLAKTLNISPGNSHRALDDAKTCLRVALECFRRFGARKTLGEFIDLQGVSLNWSDFSIEALREKEVGNRLVRAILDEREVHMVYSGGSHPGSGRSIQPTGIVRGPQRDFLVAYDPSADKEKRYYLNRIVSIK